MEIKLPPLRTKYMQVKNRKVEFGLVMILEHRDYRWGLIPTTEVEKRNKNFLVLSQKINEQNKDC